MPSSTFSTAGSDAARPTRPVAAVHMSDHAMALAGWFGRSGLALEHHHHDATSMEVAVAFAVAH